MSKRKEKPDSSYQPPSHEFWELNAREHGFYPSDTLIKFLSELPRGTKVGIESPPNLTSDRSYYGDKLTHFPGQEVLYWNYLVAECQRLKLNVVYLDDIQLHQQVVRLERIAALTDEDLHPVDYLKYHEPHSPSREWQLRRRSYSAGILAWYLKDIERARVIRQNQKNFGVQTSVVTPDMENMLIVLKLEEMGYLGTDEDSSLYLMNVPDSDYKASSIDDTVLKKRLLLRRTQAVKTARLIPSKKPDYIGIYQQGHHYTPEEGLFEIYLREGIEINGFGIDVLGDSLVSGSITPDQIEFQKEYLRGRSEVTGRLTYSGIFKDNRYQGEWSAHGGGRGSFILVPYQDGMNVRELMNSSLAH